MTYECDGVAVRFLRTDRVPETGAILRMRRLLCTCDLCVVRNRRDETADVEESPVAEEPVAAPKPVGLTLKEYEEQRKAKMSALLGKKQPRAVETVQGERIQKVHEDYFVVWVVWTCEVG